MKGNEGYWGGEISIISQNFLKSPSILFYPLESSISQTSPKDDYILVLYFQNYILGQTLLPQVVMASVDLWGFGWGI
jgi:hypothetical protein